MSSSLYMKPATSAGLTRRACRRATVVVASAHGRRQVLSAAAAAAVTTSALLFGSQAAFAVGIESVDFPSTSLNKPAGLSRNAESQKQKLAEADEAFQNSNTLKELLAKSEANKAKNRKEIQNKYCYRQAELGIGDCGGLRYIPGLTESGKQKTPKWLADLLGVEVPETNPAGGKTLQDLIYAEQENGAK